MCGISIIINTDNQPVSESEIILMNNRIIHRGPDGEGYYFGENFAFGHRRLSIIDLSEKAKQPMHYLKKYVITYNGEVYNYIELREELMKNGYSFNSSSDTEVIIAAYDRWGEECVLKFNGMWYFVIFDKIKNILFCSRDRFGIKPFNYAIVKNKFLIGSEIKQFLDVSGFIPKLNYLESMNFLALSKLNMTEDTMFKGVKVLNAGYNLIYDLSTHLWFFDKNSGKK